MKHVLRNFPIRLKMITSHGIIALLSIFCASVALVGIVGLIFNLTTIHENTMSSMVAAGELKFATADIERSILGVISEESTEHYSILKESLDDDVADINQAFTTLSTQLDAFCSSDDATQLYQKISQMFDESEPIRIEITNYLKDGNFSQAQSLYLQQYRNYLNDIITLSEELKVEIANQADEYCLRAIQVNNTGVIVILILIVISLVLGTYLTHVVSDSVRLPVRQLMEVSEQMKQGNLSAAENITYESEDELGKLADSMRETLLFLHGYVEEISDTLHNVAIGDLTAQDDSISMFRGDFASIRESLIYILNNLNRTLESIDVAAEQVNVSALQIASGAQELAQGAGEQAASVEELSSAVTNISNRINTTADHANAAMNTSLATSEQAQVCNAQMQHMMEAMAELTEKATQISKIVKTIEDIAFQTNILALNAAVEAARAGAAGKGFAVVADEVRNLAAKSAEASKNTSELIGATVNAVNNSTKVLEETAQSLAVVVHDSQAASELSGQIAQAATAQAAAVSQISQNIGEISAVVNTTSSTSEENAATSQEMSGQAMTLREMLGQFKLRR